MKADVARAECAPQIATERNEPVLKQAPLDPDKLAALEDWRKSPFFGLCEQFGWRPRKPQCSEVELYLLEHKKNPIVPSRCFKITEPPWSEAVALQWGFYVHERFSITDFEDLVERPDANDPDYSARTYFLPSAERWRSIRPHLSDDDEIWTVGTSPSAWGFIIVSKGSPICFVFTDASY